MIKKISLLVMVILLLFSSGCGTPRKPNNSTNNQTTNQTTINNQNNDVIDENGKYTSKEDVALYIHTYNKLPNNFMTKSQAKSHGWTSGPLEKVCPGYCIGGDKFLNIEGNLPSGHTYYECDIDTLGNKKSRGAKRIVYSDDGLIYYTEDHYETFELLYGKE